MKTGPIKVEDLSLADLLDEMKALNASDLFITAGDKPYFRVDGTLTTRKRFPKLSATQTSRLAYSMLKDFQRKHFEEELELDLSFSYRGVGRFRANLFRQKGCVSAALRMLPSKIIPLEYLGLPPKVETFVEKSHGLVLVTGATGSGKSTTLASMLDRINEKYAKHIITIEDPIEYVHYNKKSVVEQREVYSDTKSFGTALKYVLRQNPDVVVIGEMRDMETMEAALNIADTGHLTFGTLHTSNAVQTINRIIDSFPADKQPQIRTQLSFVLEGIICQTLIPKQYERGRALACEVMMITPGVRNLVRQEKTEQMYSEIQVSGKLGSQSMNQSLGDLYRRGIISYHQAKYHCDPDKLDELTTMLENTVVTRRGGSPGSAKQGKKEVEVEEILAGASAIAKPVKPPMTKGPSAQPPPPPPLPQSPPITPAPDPAKSAAASVEKFFPKGAPQRTVMVPKKNPPETPETPKK